MCMLSFRQRVKADLIKNRVIVEEKGMDKSLIKEMVANILKEIAPVDTELKRLHRALDSVRNICPHEEENKGHRYNYTVYECKICGRIVHW